MALGVLLIAGAIGLWLFPNLAAQSLTAEAVPDSVAGKPLSQKTVGPAAIEDVTQLHGKAFPLTAAAVAHAGAWRRRSGVVGSRRIV